MKEPFSYIFVLKILELFNLRKQYPFPFLEGSNILYPFLENWVTLQCSALVIFHVLSDSNFCKSSEAVHAH